VREGNRTINDVLHAVAARFELTREQVVSERAPVPFRARRIALHLACRVTQRSFPQIGAAFGGVSSTNVLFAKRKIERDMIKDAELAAEVEGIKASLLTK